MAPSCTATASRTEHACVCVALCHCCVQPSRECARRQCVSRVCLTLARVLSPQLESESLIPRLMHARCPGFSFQRTKFDQDNSKAGTGRRAVGALLAPRVSCYTLEVSFYAATTGYTGLSGKGSNHEVYTQDSCAWPTQLLLLPVPALPALTLCVCRSPPPQTPADLKLGRDVALTFLDYHAAVAGQRAKAATATSRSKLHAHMGDRPSASGGARGMGMTGGSSSLTATPILSSGAPPTTGRTGGRDRGAGSTSGSASGGGSSGRGASGPPNGLAARLAAAGSHSASSKSTSAAGGTGIRSARARARTRDR